MAEMNPEHAKITNYYYYLALFLSVFAFCAHEGWEKTAWFVVFPLGLGISFAFRKRKNPN
jgi:hypothetical protein